jgi:hypothetical protein
MLSDVIEFVKSRASIVDRATTLREINFAWKEIWAIDDLPNAVQEITAQSGTEARISLPHYVGKIRAIKQNCNRALISLYTPKSNYTESAYIQSPFSWVELGTNPLNATITNATTVNLEIAEAESEQITVTLLGETDNASEDREQLIIPIGTTNVESTKRFTNITQATKDKFTLSDVKILDGNDVELGSIPNAAFEARNLIIQVTDSCNTNPCPSGCFDILYKRVAPILYYDEQAIPNGYDEILMTSCYQRKDRTRKPSYTATSPAR